MRKLLRTLEKPVSWMDRTKELEPIIQAFIDVYDPTRILLFGSATTENFYIDSDFDFLVVLTNSADVGLAWKKLKEVRGSAKRPLDVIFRSEPDFVAGFSGGASLIAQELGNVLYSKVNS